MSNPPFKIGTLGEVALRVNDMPAMVRFYRDRLGLPMLNGNEDSKIVFFNLGSGLAGHTTVLALFAHDAPDQRDVHPVGTTTATTGAGASLHHFALSLTEAEQDKAIAWFNEIGQAYKIEVFDWVGWRGVFLIDPDGNTVELVAKLASEDI